MIELLGVDDLDKKNALFDEMVSNICKSNLLPELNREDHTHYKSALLAYSKTNNVLYCRTAEGLALCILTEQDVNPHIIGSGLVVLLTLAYGDATALHKLLREVRVFAKFLKKDWLALHHRTRPYEYRCKYYKLIRSN